MAVFEVQILSRTFENLTNIRENIPEANWQHRWAFRQLFGYVEYKAEVVGYRRQNGGTGEHLETLFAYRVWIHGG